MSGKFYNLLGLLMFACLYAGAQPGPGTFSKHIKIDQFGYLPNAKKTAVIVDPQTGYNAAEAFSPGTGTNQYQLREWTTGAVVFSGTLSSWNGGATHTQSGDKGWWFDFSPVITPGSYYIYDVANNVGSYRFEINSNVYKDILKQAMRVYFYQRCNFAKQPPYTDAKWADAAAFGGVNQDYAVRSRWNKTSAATARDLHGGWYDAGDCNKYTTFTFTPVCNLLETYRQYPTWFTDDYNIPESGNGIPDVLDELKWELDWLMRMQDATGTNGLLLKVGADNYNGASPPSADNNPRYYVPECTSATLTGAADFALASIVYKLLGNTAMTNYGNDLLTRAINAWNRAKSTTNNFTSFETACDDQNIVSGDADADVDAQRELVITAAVYLYEATGDVAYRTVFDGLYTNARPIAYYWWGPYYQPVQRALLRYTQLPGATTSVVNNIRTIKAAQNGIMSINDYNNGTDLYRAHMPDDQYSWGSNETKASAALDNFDFANYGINSSQSALYKEVGSSYLHWFHGVNPMGKVMLSNMYAYGGDSCVNEIYHSWFGDGTNWDNVLTSLYGPAPGYVPGGPNKNFTVPSITPPAQQPPQKSFREWNTGWNGSFSENSWEITEPAIYTQSAYISLLVRVMATAPPAIPLPVHSLTLSGARTATGIDLKWQTVNETPADHYVVERSTDGKRFREIYRIKAQEAVSTYSFTDRDPAVLSAGVFYRIKETGSQGAVYYSSVLKLSRTDDAGGLTVYPNPANDELTIDGYNIDDNVLVLTIVDISGRTAFKDSWLQAKGHYSKRLPIGSLPHGTYYLQVSASGTASQVSFLKQ